MFPGQSIVAYHATDAAAAVSIRANGFRCGSSGLAGGGIYFATSEQDASRKSNHGNDVVLTCQLTLGRTLTLDQHGDPTMTLHKLNGMGYDSVKPPQRRRVRCVRAVASACAVAAASNRRDLYSFRKGSQARSARLVWGFTE